MKARAASRKVVDPGRDTASVACEVFAQDAGQLQRAGNAPHQICDAGCGRGQVRQRRRGIVDVGERRDLNARMAFGRESGERASIEKPGSHDVHAAVGRACLRSMFGFVAANRESAEGLGHLMQVSGNGPVFGVGGHRAIVVSVSIRPTAVDLCCQSVVSSVPT